MLRKLTGLLAEGGKTLNVFITDLSDSLGEAVSVQDATRELTITVRVEKSIIELGMTDARLRAKFDDTSVETPMSRELYERVSRGARGTELPDFPLPNFQLPVQHRDPEIEQAIHKAIDGIHEVRTYFLGEVVNELNGNTVLKQHFLKFLEERGVEKYLTPLQEAGLN